MSKTKIWVLNATEHLIKHNPEAIISILGYDNCELGNRRDFEEWKDGYPPPRNEPYNLMPDIEYFVPIAAKCIGSRFETFSDPRLKQIFNFYEEQWNQADSRIKINNTGPVYRSFWTHECGPDGMSKMITKDPVNPDNCLGYYDLLERTGESHILIGYSEGGLVARYLSWLDENIFKKGIIKAIITISSPNYGSPLANPDNADQITSGFIETIFTIFSMVPGNYGDLIKYLQSSVQYKNIAVILNLLIKSVANDEILTHKESTKLMKILATAKKWTSGLTGDKATAFADMDIFNIEKYPLSILSTINREPLKTVKFSSIISADSRFKDTAMSLLPWYMRIIFYIFILNEKLFLNRKLNDNLKIITKIFQDEIMTEKNKTGNIKIIQDRIDQYYKGSDILPVEANDFIMPSSYQVFDEIMNNRSNFYGNYINKKANHNTGMEADMAGGRENLRLIKQILKKI